MLQQSVADLSQLKVASLVELFVIDATAPSIGAGVTVNVTNYIKADGSSVVWQGTTFSPYPCGIEGVQTTTQGASDEPSFSVSNATGIFSALCVTYQDLVGAKVIRKRVLSTYLDGNAGANVLAGLPDDVWYIKQKKAESRTAVQWSLASGFDLDGVQIPRMRVNCDFCQVRNYRGAECSYTGTYFSDVNGVALTGTTNRGVYSSANTYSPGDYFYTTYASIRYYYVCIATASPGTLLTNTSRFTPDVCTRRLNNGCEPRFGSQGIPFLAFPGTALLPQT